MLTWLKSPADFPAVDHAMTAPSGLLAAGGALSVPWLVAAYRQGIFPWFSAGQPILWWSPDPRMVLWTHQLHIPTSLLRTIHKNNFEIRINTAFAQVITACAAPRSQQVATWISEEMQQAYLTMHLQGMAHSFEAWQNEELVGGLYGVALGKMFYGESMFTRVTDASKIAFVSAVQRLRTLGVEMIDCQMYTKHLARFGAIEMPRTQFMAHLNLAVTQPDFKLL